MVYYSMNDYKLKGFIKSKKQGKMYDAILEEIKTGKIKKVSFGANNYQNFRDITGLNAYPHLIHNDEKRRSLYKKRHKRYLKDGYYSPSFFSFYFLW